jgi:hypothetical protein
MCIQSALVVVRASDTTTSPTGIACACERSLCIGTSGVYIAIVQTQAALVKIQARQPITGPTYVTGTSEGSRVVRTSSMSITIMS